ncbi:hypothetical protein SNEBB_006220 [Seison nebaliae]|nr:hypothetical protein SNEBB_006220 [Seison nebaliae]
MFFTCLHIFQCCVNSIIRQFNRSKSIQWNQCNHATCLTDYKLKRRILFPSKNKLLPTKLRKRLNLLEINVENVIEKIRMNTTEWPYNGPPPVFKSNGCGNNWIKNLFDINYFLKKFMTKSSQNCCNNHDACYSTCGISRYDCDLEFLKCLETECMLSKNFSSTSCISAAVRMSHAVASNGCPNFIAAQTGSCECYHFKRMDNICEIHGDQLVPTTLPDDLMSYCIETSEAKEGLMNCHNNKQCRLVRDKKNHKIYCRCRFQCREKIIIRDISKMHLKSIKKVSSFRDIITNLFTDIFGKQRT